jgi:hypothetical protein
MKLSWGHPWHVPVSGSPGIIYASVYEGAEFGIDRAQAEKMGSVAALEGMAEVDPEIRKRGIRALPGGTTASRTTRSAATPGTWNCSPACWGTSRWRR